MTTATNERTTSGWRRHLLYILLIAAPSGIIYFDHWSGRTLFTGKDTFTAYMPLINFETDCLRAGSLPLWNPFMNFGFPYVEDVLNSSLFPTHFLMAFTGSSMVVYQRELLFWIFLGGVGVYLCVREFGHSGTAGLLAAVSFMFCGQMVSLPAWSIILYNACCFPYLILGYHRAKGADDPFSILSILFFALPIFSGYVSSSVHGIYYFIGYVVLDSLLSRRPVFGIQYLALTGGLGMMLAMPKLLPMVLSMGQYERMSVAEARANPSEIISWYNLMSFVLPVKYYFSVYIGQVGIMALFAAAIRRAVKVNALLILFLLSAWLLMVDSDGSFSILHRAANAVLPMLKLTRNEWMYWNYPLTFAILYLSAYLDAFLSADAFRPKLIAAGLYAGLLTALFLAEYNAEVHLNAYLTHLFLVGLWLAVALLARRSSVRTALAAALVLAEFLLVFNRVAVDKPAAREGGTVAVNVTHQVYSSESFLDDQLVRQTMPMRVLDDTRRPSVRDSRKNPVLISGLDGNFIDNMNQKRFTGWWYNTQERSDFVELKESPQLAQMDGEPLFRYFNRSTREELQDRVMFDDISCSNFQFTVRSGEPGFFLLNQMYDDRWQVLVDGKPVALVHANRFFMGIPIEPGEHRVRFTFSDRLFFIALGAALVTLVGMGAAAVYRARRPVRL